GTGMKTPPAQIEADRYENRTGTGSKYPPVYQSENPTDTETILTKETSKQQQAEAATPEARSLLQKEGFTGKVVDDLAARFHVEQIRAQIAWLPERAPSRNRLGMLRRAIEENWSAPEELRHAEVSSARSFAQHFYAGLAGNPGVPVAEPSAHDLQQSTTFVDRLLALKPAAGDPKAWGRQFAAYAREHKTNRDMASLVLALRLHGDGWLLCFGREQQRLRDQEREQQRAVHRAAHEAEWLRFIAEAEMTCQSEKPDEYSAFVQTQQAQRWNLSGVDTERSRLAGFQRHFNLPDFWHWDAEFNSQPFPPCA
ncbi:MAG TPA: hypothetical protein VEX38_03165, partial [Fimbriimonadaceae bacterium]|nr:hypothetical protein [Fimbriimonadaceae bacterium]